MKKILALILALVVSTVLLASCAGTAFDEDSPVAAATLAGPTGMGMVAMLEDPAYDISIYTAPDLITPKIINNEVSIAAVPANLASVLYNKMGGSIKVLAVSTMGVLYILENGDSVNSLADLDGKTIYATGQGATPEYVLNMILEQNGINATVEFMGAHADLANAMAAGDVTLALLPEPFVSVVLAKNPDVSVKIDINEEWKNATGTDLPMGVTVVSNALADDKAAMEKIIADYSASVDYVNTDTDAAAADIEASGIVASAAIAKSSIPRCAISFVTGQDCKDMLGSYLKLMYDADPASVGGALPDDDFYYMP